MPCERCSLIKLLFALLMLALHHHGLRGCSRPPQKHVLLQRAIPACLLGRFRPASAAGCASLCGMHLLRPKLTSACPFLQELPDTPHLRIDPEYRSRHTCNQERRGKLRDKKLTAAARSSKKIDSFFTCSVSPKLLPMEEQPLPRLPPQQQPQQAAGDIPAP